MKNPRCRNKRKGVALIITIGVLSLIALIATSFAFNMIADYNIASNLLNGSKARMAAEAGVSFAITYMRNLAVTNFNAAPIAIWSYTDGSQPSFDSADAISGNSTSGSLGNLGRNKIGVYSLKVTDTAAQININDSRAQVGYMLETLVSILGAPLAAGDGTTIYSDRFINGPFPTKEAVMRISGFTRAKYEKIRDYITVNGYIDNNSENTSATDSTLEPKAPINVNTAGPEILRSVLQTLIGADKANALAAAIITQRNTAPFTTWNAIDNTGFNYFIDNVSITPALTAADKSNIKDNANPNRAKPGTHTTDFCFQPGGIYEIVSVGKVGMDTNSDGDLSDSGDRVVASQDVVAIVKIYDILNYTTKEQFRDYDANYNLKPVSDRPTFARVTWLNSCPVKNAASADGGDDQGLNYASNYATIPNSLKLGFWDNFDEDNDNNNRKGYSWSNWQQQSGVMNISDKDGDGNNEIWGEGWPKFVLNDTNKWTFGDNFSIRVSLMPDPLGNGSEDSGHLEFHWAGVVRDKIWTQHWGFLFFRKDITLPPDLAYLHWVDGVPTPTVASDLNGAIIPPESQSRYWAREGKDFFDSKILLHLWDPPDNTRAYNIGNLYGLTELVPDHYNNWLSEQNNDQFHGVFPVKETLKLVVNSTGVITPNYRAYLAVYSGWHYYYDYSNGWSIGSQGYTPTTTGYVLIPFHDDASNSTTPDRYNYDRYPQSQPNRWQTTQWYPVLYGNNAVPQWDEIRIIPNNGYYQFPPVTFTDAVRWGTASWTLTIPSTADAAREVCSLRADTGSGLSGVSLNGPIGGISSSMTLRIDLTTTDADYSETPVLEDITFTYLAPVKMLYRK